MRISGGQEAEPVRIFVVRGLELVIFVETGFVGRPDKYRAYQVREVIRKKKRNPRRIYGSLTFQRSSQRTERSHPDAYRQLSFFPSPLDRPRDSFVAVKSSTSVAIFSGFSELLMPRDESSMDMSPDARH